MHIRTQYAVGQGFFHAGELREEENVHLRYVVDCGATVDTFNELFGCIRRFRHTLSEEDQLDVLFITHAHFDHLSGVAALVNGLKVETVVLPLINVVDRLYAFAHAHATNAGATGSDGGFFEAFIADPIAAVAELGPRRILLVEGGSDGGAPFSKGPDDGDRGPEGLPDGDNEPPFRTKLIGRGKVRSSDAGAMVNGAQVLIIPQTLALMPSAATHLWLLAPYVDPAIAALRSTFIAALARQKGIKEPALEQHLKDPNFVLALLTTERAKLVAAYSSVTKDLNITSLCVYSGPSPDSPMNGRYRSQFGSWPVSGYEEQKVAWLGTGDAALSDNVRYTNFSSHYGRLLHEVLTLTLPHHGSAVGFHPKLTTDINPHFYVAAASLKYGTHPGTEVIQAVASSGRFLSVVNANLASEIVEKIALS